MPAIQAIQAREILDSQGFPTIEVGLWLDNGSYVDSSVPNGTGVHPFEKKAKYDKNPDHMAGKGVQQAVKLINDTIAPQLINQDPTQQEQLDQLLEGLDQSENKEAMGVNTIAVLSKAIAKAGAVASNLPLYQYLFQKYQLAKFLKIPTCMYGLINGGGYGTNNLDLQEFLVIPASHVDYRVSLEIETAIREELRNMLKDRKASYSTGSLGGFTPHLQKNSDGLEFIVEASRKTSYILSRDFFLGIDIGGQNLGQKDKYSLRDKSTSFSSKELLEFYKNLKKKYNLIYLEDPFSTKDLKSWQDLTAELGRTTKISSDALTGTQLPQTEQAIKDMAANAIVIKPSQNGTVTGTINVIKIAKENDWQVIVSQRTGETNDDFLADFAVGIGADFVKFGPTNRGEMVVKYNRFARIYVELTYQNNNKQKESTMMDPKKQTLSSSGADDKVADDTKGGSATNPIVPPASLAEPVPEPSAAPTPAAAAAPAAATPTPAAAPTPEVDPLAPAGTDSSLSDAATGSPDNAAAAPVDATAVPAAPTAMPAPTELDDTAQDAIKTSLEEIGVPKANESGQNQAVPAPAGIQPSSVTPPAPVAPVAPAPAATPTPTPVADSTKTS